VKTTDRADEAIRTADAYHAMREFLEAYWERGERSSDDLADLLSSLQIDRALWRDFLDAIDQVKRANHQ
jgi:hypothetical protein